MENCLSLVNFVEDFKSESDVQFISCCFNNFTLLKFNVILFDYFKVVYENLGFFFLWSLIH
jgi:hypothetical protein